MTPGAFLALIVCRLALADGLEEIEVSKEDPKSAPTVELLISLLSGAADSSERQNRARLENDGPFSDIPDSAFTLDEGIRVNLDPAPVPTPASKSDEADDDRLDYYQPRSVYLGSSEQQSERPPDVWRACQGLARERTGPAYDVLLMLCAELLDAAAPPSAQRGQYSPRANDPIESSTPCSCCTEASNLEQSARRDFMPMGDDADLRHPVIMPPPPWAGDIQD